MRVCCVHVDGQLSVTIPRGSRGIIVETSSSLPGLIILSSGRGEVRQIAALSNDTLTFRLAGTELQYSRQTLSGRPTIRLTALGPVSDVIVVKVTASMAIH